MPQPLQTLHPWQGRYLAYIVCSAGQRLQPAYNAPGLLWKRCQIMLSWHQPKDGNTPRALPPPPTHTLACAGHCNCQHLPPTYTPYVR
jgi:hypothetical protein